MKLENLIKGKKYHIVCDDHWKGIAEFLGEIDNDGHTAPVGNFMCDDNVFGCFAADEIIGPVNYEEDIQKFSAEIEEKLKDKCRGKDTLFLYSVPDLVRQMVESKMKKENWIRG